MSGRVRCARTGVLWLWLVVAVSGVTVAGCGATGGAALTAEIRQVADAYVAAFNARDAAAVAELWTEDGELVDQATGQCIRGRSRILKAMKSVLAGAPGMEAETVSLAAQPVAPDVALAQGLSRFAPKTGAVETSAFVALYVRRGGQWKIHRVWQTPVKPNPHYDELADLAWMIGRWSSQADGRTTANVCRWGKNRTFITRSFEVTDGSGLVGKGTEVIGWDPAERRIRSWTFDSRGGFAECLWAQKDGHWHPGEITDHKPASADEHRKALAGLDWMVGQWAHRGEGESVEMSARWVADGMFLLRRFKAARPGQWEHEGISILRWDPQQKRIRSWMFDTDGGHSEAVWSREGDRWVAKTRHVLPDGRRASAILACKIVDGDAFTWQRIAQEVDGEVWPSGPEVKLVRQPADK